ncbi:hypothetical protein CXF83_09505 [Shewanella sp. Choline-02u-19]|uniref:hypothetical protein n=1 Tax=Shewanella TaxID=22 RepID=UPI000C3228D3|nr:MULTISPECIES: hypothetical protein [Shewanella]MCL1051723.1 hypothetical protein [Shewanella abyssi]MCL1057936.1 hypothetical protein [Shewanella gelidimarina]PKG56585.1 hypothetical protein CXF82_13805 [Shewanella sp. GutDb-MelDb]PKG75804.1 hypothetical protein CXF86_05640 [Shewanella sp. GutCb]PKH60608.1 hypothetical protein CXF84_01870 [Shewanella sp. Bg11-22]
MADVSQSASLSSIAAYLKLTYQYDQQTALVEAKEVMQNLVRMRQKGFITGWYFDEQGHLELLPSDTVMHQINPTK